MCFIDWLRFYILNTCIAQSFSKVFSVFSDVLVTQNEVSSHVQQVDGVETRKEGEQTGSSSALQKQSSER